jgi:hypothetical protein
MKQKNRQKTILIPNMEFIFGKFNPSFQLNNNRIVLAANMFAMHKIRNGMLRNREKSNISFKMFETEAGKHVHLSQKVFMEFIFGKFNPSFQLNNNRIVLAINLLNMKDDQAL